jgi:hypothetical protein
MQGPEEDLLRLDPKAYPKQVDLELPEEVIDGINAIASRTGKSFSEVATDILSKALGNSARILALSAMQIWHYFS